MCSLRKTKYMPVNGENKTYIEGQKGNIWTFIDYMNLSEVLQEMLRYMVRYEKEKYAAYLVLFIYLALYLSTFFPTIMFCHLCFTILSWCDPDYL